MLERDTNKVAHVDLYRISAVEWQIINIIIFPFDGIICIFPLKN